MTPQLDIVCFSHLRWDFVYQRPQHLLSRFSKTCRVFFMEEPRAFAEGETEPRLDISSCDPQLNVVVPRVPASLTGTALETVLRRLLDELFVSASIRNFVRWYYTPMALGFSRHLAGPLVTVYDCMDELSAFRDAPPELLLREAELFQCADLVFTGGQSLYEAKRRHHPSVHAFPSSVDKTHFARARMSVEDPVDQVAIPGPRLGFFGVLDERLDVELLAGVADLRPEWQLVLLGPTVKIEPTSLPRRHNIHYLGPKTYAELPEYLARWDVAMIPFARNDATRFISPTKTPEYLAAGCPVVATSIHDVVQPYGANGLVRIADQPDAFVQAAAAAMTEDQAARWARSDQFLASMSWDCTWAAMDELIREAAGTRVSVPALHAAVAA